jgi:hypothetical protein
MESAMTKLHFYVPEDVATQIQRKAAQSGLAVSTYLAELAKRDAGINGAWPKNYFDICGSWAGEPVVREAQPSLEEPP